MLDVERLLVEGLAVGYHFSKEQLCHFFFASCFVLKPRAGWASNVLLGWIQPCNQDTLFVPGDQGNLNRLLGAIGESWHFRVV